MSNPPSQAAEPVVKCGYGSSDERSHGKTTDTGRDSNNLAENSMRPVAIGRKNWIHIGSEKAGPRVAAILSVVESCRRLKLPVRDYLAAVLPGLADCPIQRLPELTPAAMARQRC